uniref:Apple domain-containing protein n=1 Tax=Meloidogyne incognita TaxID=6306 RepID=A0A914M6U0_MELIC
MTILLPFLLFLFTGISAETHKFHHCFDRYNNHKIIGGRFIIQPFHSEWRIGGGEARCIDFCIRSLSRCASIVFDKHEHICHYFSIGGLDNVVPEKGFVYLSLISKECIIGSEEKFEANQDMRKNTTNTSTPTVTTSPTSPPPPSPPIIVTPKKDNRENQSIIEEPPIEKKQTSKFSEQKVEQFLLNEEHFTTTTITTTEKPLEEVEAEAADSISFLEEIDRELREKEEENLEESEEELEESPLKEEQNLIIPTLSMLKIKKRIKNEEEELKEIRRHPRLDNSINNKNNRVDNYLIKQQNRVGKINKLKEENEGCGTGKQAIWIAVENARFNPSSIDHSSFSPTNHDTNSQATTSFTTETPKECAKFCSNTTTTFFDNFGRRRRCNAFSFNENEKLCQLAYSNVEFPSMLVQTTEADFVQRAFRRLCYGGKGAFLKKSRTAKIVKCPEPENITKRPESKKYFKMSRPLKNYKTPIT